MATETDLLNDALGQIGQQRINSIEDPTVNANYCRTFWPSLRRALLRGHFWNFAEGRATLAREATAPAFGYAYAYTLPDDFLRVKEYNGIRIDSVDLTQLQIRAWFKIEGKKVLSNDSVVAIVYVRDETNPDLWDGMFYEAAAAMLASKLAVAITKNVTLSDQRFKIGQELLADARAVDGQESPPQRFITDDLTRGRDV